MPMKKVLLLILPLLLLLIADNASAAPFFRIIDVSPIHVAPNSDANFTATVKDFGPDGGYVQLIFRNVTSGISVNQTDGYKYVLPTGTRKFNCTVKAGNIAPGNYSFQIGIYAQDAKVNWITAYVVVEPLPFVKATPVVPNVPSANASTKVVNVSKPQANKTASPPTQQKAPALSIPVVIMMLLLAARRRG